MPRTALLTGAVLVAGFVITAVIRSNYEFLFYSAILIVLLGLLFALDRRFDYSNVALWGFNLWLLLHLLGGMATLDGVRLYDLILLDLVREPYWILRYDQVIHVYCYIVMALLVLESLNRMLNWPSTPALVVVSILAATGIGGLNEILEFAAVVLLGSTGVGDYTNTALDLVANLVGATIGGLLGVVLSKAAP